MVNNLSLLLVTKDKMTLMDRKMPSGPGSGEVLLRMLRVGICGTDLRNLKSGSINGVIVNGNGPVVVGHESSGQVIEVGPDVSHLKAGDIVSIEPNVCCRECYQCKSGRSNLCTSMIGLGASCDGSACRYFKHPARGCFKLPEGISPEEGALIEPLSVGISACRRAGLQFGMTVLITGAGPVGFMVLLSAKAFGAGHVIVTDVNKKRLAMAMEQGADAVIHTESSDAPEDVAKRAVKVNGDQFDVTIDCVGFESTVETGIHATRPGGKVVVVGVGASRVNVPLMKAVESEIDIIGSFIYKNTWPFCIQMLQEKKIAVKQLATHVFKLEDALEAFEVAKRGDGIKVIIDCEE